ncbi:MAG: O-antigen ligase family protein [Deltaproteobacteria bacterium]|nr:O-antigen ligase family protein [Deltaproteobacteria bacterium]
MTKTYLAIALGIFIVSLSITIVGVEISLFLLLTFILTKYITTKDISIRQPLFKETLLIPVFAMISVFFSNETITNWQRFSAFWVFLAYPVLFYSVNNLDFRYIERAMNISIIVSAVLSVYAIIQHFTGINLFGNIVRHSPDGIRYLSTAHFNKHSTFAFTTTFVLSYTIIRLFIHQISFKERILLLVASLTMLYAVLFSYVRAPVITAIAGATMILFMVRKKYLLYPLATVFFLLMTLYIISPSVITKYIESLSSQSESGWQRLFIYKRSLEIYADNIGTGIGFGNFTHYTYIYFDNFYRDFQVRCHSHNLYLQYLLEMGVIGFVLILLLISKFSIYSFSVRNKIKERREFSLYLWGNLVFIIIVLSSLMQCTIYDGHIAFFLFFAMALVMSLYQRYKDPIIS